MCHLAGRGHGRVRGREARVRLLVLEVGRGVPGQNTVLNTLSEDVSGHELHINTNYKNICLFSIKICLVLFNLVALTAII